NMFFDGGGVSLLTKQGGGKAGIRFRVYISEGGRESFAGIYEYDGSRGAYRPVKMFLGGE
ncbi:MAG: hypothetical protein NC223_11375, partial [Butyrivibrio sp.]|nr:hypothetical protein [Butyrivibrio sp.]